MLSLTLQPREFNLPAGRSKRLTAGALQRPHSVSGNSRRAMFQKQMISEHGVPVSADSESLIRVFWLTSLVGWHGGKLDGRFGLHHDAAPQSPFGSPCANEQSADKRNFLTWMSS
jgi:hypothetical protein